MVYKMVRYFSLFHLVLVLLFILLRWNRNQVFPEPPFYQVYFILLGIPLAVSYVLHVGFKQKRFERHLHWITFIPVNLGIIITCVYLFDFLNPLENWERFDLEEKRVQRSVRQWLKQNTAYPDDYLPLSFSDFNQNCKGCPDEFEPIGYQKIQKTVPAYAYYFIEHRAILKDKKGVFDTANLWFQLTSDKQIVNVRTATEFKKLPHPDLKSEAYLFRALYGNGRENLELEMNGYSEDVYYFKQFSSEGWLRRYVPYSNGEINGRAYYLWDGDTVAIIDYKRGLRSGYVMEICPNGIVGFKGRTQNGKFNGLASSWYCNGVKSSEGYMLNDENVGVWKHYDESGRLTGTRNFGHTDLLDSLKMMEGF